MSTTTLKARIERLEHRDEPQTVYVGREPTADELRALEDRGLRAVVIPDNGRDAGARFDES
jgi:hypothetical protein